MSSLGECRTEPETESWPFIRRLWIKLGLYGTVRSSISCTESLFVLGQILRRRHLAIRGQQGVVRQNHTRWCISHAWPGAKGDKVYPTKQEGRLREPRTRLDWCLHWVGADSVQVDDISRPIKRPLHASHFPRSQPVCYTSSIINSTHHG
jgi:hypothetical protein